MTDGRTGFQLYMIGFFSVMTGRLVSCHQLLPKKYFYVIWLQWFFLQYYSNEVKNKHVQFYSLASLGRSIIVYILLFMRKIFR